MRLFVMLTAVCREGVPQMVHTPVTPHFSCYFIFEETAVLAVFTGHTWCSLLYRYYSLFARRFFKQVWPNTQPEAIMATLSVLS